MKVTVGPVGTEGDTEVVDHGQGGGNKVRE